MKLIIKLPKDKEKGEVIFKKDDQIVASAEFLRAKISEELLETISNLLKNNKLTPGLIGDFSLDTDLGENYTAYRVAKMTLETLKWGNFHKNQ